MKVFPTYILCFYDGKIFSNFLTCLGQVNSVSWKNEGPQQTTHSPVDEQHLAMSGRIPHSTMSQNMYSKPEQHAELQNGTLQSTCTMIILCEFMTDIISIYCLIEKNFFNESNLILHWFCSTALWLVYKNMHHLVKQSDTKPILWVSHTFFCDWHWMCVFVYNFLHSHWLQPLLSCVVTCQFKFYIYTHMPYSCGHFFKTLLVWIYYMFCSVRIKMSLLILTKGVTPLPPHSYSVQPVFIFVRLQKSLHIHVCYKLLLQMVTT